MIWNLKESSVKKIILKIVFIIGALIAFYAIVRNLDIIKIILVYLKDSILKK